MKEKLEKAEGSRGGKVIGHTASGKPVYENSYHRASIKRFSQKDHLEACKIHQRKADSYKKKLDRLPNLTYTEDQPALNEKRSHLSEMHSHHEDMSNAHYDEYEGDWTGTGGPYRKLKSPIRRIKPLSKLKKAYAGNEYALVIADHSTSGEGLIGALDEVPTNTSIVGVSGYASAYMAESRTDSYEHLIRPKLSELIEIATPVNNYNFFQVTTTTDGAILSKKAMPWLSEASAKASVSPQPLVILQEIDAMNSHERVQTDGNVPGGDEGYGVSNPQAFVVKVSPED